MRLAIVGTVVLGAAILCFFLCVFLDYDPRLLLVDWQRRRDLPIPISAQMELASSSGSLKRESLTVICTAQGVRFVERYRLVVVDRSVIKPGPPQYDPHAAHEKIVIVGPYISLPRPGVDIEVPARLTNWGRVDTMMSDPLTDADTGMLMGWLAWKPPVRLGINFGENGRNVVAHVLPSALRTFVARCRGTKTDS